MALSKGATMERRVKLISDLQQNITPDMIPTALVANEVAEERIKLTIVTLTRVICEIKRDTTFIETNLSALLDAWPGILQWIEFIYSRCVDKKDFGEKLMVQSLRIISWIIVSFCNDRGIGLRKLIASTPGVFPILIPPWLREATNDPLIQLPRDRDFSAALISLVDDKEQCDVIIGDEEQCDINVFAFIVRAADGGAEAVAKAAMEPLRNIIANNPPDLDQFLKPMRLVSAFITSRYPPLRSSMYIQRLLPTLVEIMSVIGAQPISTFIHSELVVLSYRTVYAALDSANGPSCISQALDEGLLLAILRAGFRLKQPGTIDTMATPAIFHLLRQYLVYRSVLRSLAKALTKVDQYDTGPHICGPFFMAWLRFKGVAEERLGDKTEFDGAPHSALRMVPSFCGCLAQGCSNTSDSAETMRCMGCLDGLYCSVRCQRNDWPLHKDSCKKWQQLIKEGLGTPLSIHDRNFVQFIILKDFIRRSDVIKASIQRDYPRTPLSSLLVVMRYIPVPMTTEVVLLSSYTSAHDDEREATEDFRVQAVALEGLRLQVRALVRNGSAGPRRARAIPMLAPFVKQHL